MIGLLLAVVVTLAVSVGGYRKRSLDESGAAAALVVGFLCTFASLFTGATLIAFFVSSSALTKLQQKRKKSLVADFKESGQRNWVQVLSNGGIPALLALLLLLGRSSAQSLLMAYFAAMCCVTGDTWSSELGVLSKRQPRLIVGLRPVPAGTNGGMSVPGTLAAILGGTFIGAITMITLPSINPLWLLRGAAFGLVGSAVDSLLGATLQYSGFKGGVVVEEPGEDVKHISGRPVLDNHQVNALSCFVLALLGFLWG